MPSKVESNRKYSFTNSLQDVYCCDIYNSDPIQLESDAQEVEMGGFIKHIDYESQPTSTLITKGLEHVLLYDHDFVCTARHYKPEFLECF